MEVQFLPLHVSSTVYEEVHQRLDDPHLTSGQKKRLKAQRQKWQSVETPSMIHARRYMMTFSFRDVKCGEEAPWFAEPGAMLEAAMELNRDFSEEVACNLKSSMELQDLPYDPEMGLIVQVLVWAEPLIEVRLPYGPFLSLDASPCKPCCLMPVHWCAKWGG